ncbi:MAG TPA: methyltransferase domain-containing protein [Opitutaceae bacterium]|jgi:23S rRNA (guanine745-N1)-methyltransferase|nr:methyltransferase domain-containing protein [Opitutaceae bacterium]
MNPPVSVSCPFCSEPLLRSGNSYTCANRHNFDLSKEGYLSLLHGRGNYQQIGDDKQMIQARVRVHGLPAYQGLAKEIADYCPSACTAQGILDIGCGDGFFLDHVARASAPCQGVGVDISKSALAKAAKAYPGLFFVRTDAAHEKLPFADASFGLVLSIFAPRPVDEVRRITKADGGWLIVTATQDHIREVREFLPLAAIGTGKLDAPTSRSYLVLKSGTFEQVASVGHEDLVSIIEMSPSIHRLRRDFGEKWGERVPQELKVTFSFSITLLGRAAP